MTGLARPVALAAAGHIGLGLAVVVGVPAPWSALVMLLAAGCIYGLMAYLSQSILPSLLLHFLGDLLLFGLRASVTASTRRVSA